MSEHVETARLQSETLLFLLPVRPEGQIRGGEEERRRTGPTGSAGRAAPRGRAPPAGGAAEGEDGEDQSCGG